MTERKYTEMSEQQAAWHDTEIAFRRLHRQQADMLGSPPPGLFAESISQLSGWPLKQTFAWLRYAVDAGIIEKVPLVHAGSTSKESFRLVENQ